MRAAGIMKSQFAVKVRIMKSSAIRDVRMIFGLVLFFIIKDALAGS